MTLAGSIDAHAYGVVDTHVTAYECIPCADFRCPTYCASVMNGTELRVDA